MMLKCNLLISIQGNSFEMDCCFHWEGGFFKYLLHYFDFAQGCECVRVFFLCVCGDSEKGTISNFV